MFSENPIVGDVVATALTGAIFASIIPFWTNIGKMGLLDLNLRRKLVHFSYGIVFMLFWPLFRSGNHGAVIAALLPGLYTIKVLLMVLGMWKDEATVKSMNKFGDSRF